jgi:hypothetical protein
MNIAFSALSALALRSDVWIGTMPKWDCAPEDFHRGYSPAPPNSSQANLLFPNYKPNPIRSHTLGYSGYTRHTRWVFSGYTQWVSMGISMGILQNVNYGSPKSRNVRSRSCSAGLSDANLLHSRRGLSRYHAPRSALHFEDPEVIPKLGWDRSRPDPEAIPSEPRTSSGSSRDLVS